MNMEYRAFLDSLGIASFPSVGEEVYADAMREYDTQGCRYVTEAFLDALDRDISPFLFHKELIYQTAPRIRENPALSRFTLLLVHAMQRDMMAVRKDGTWTLPCPPEGADPLPYELTGLYAMLAFLPDAAVKLRAMGMPEDVVSVSLAQPDQCISIFAGCHHRPGFEAQRVRWGTYYIRPDIITIGRFGFEMRSFGGCVRAFRNAAGELKLLMDGCRLHADGMILGTAGYESEGWPNTPGSAYNADLVETDTYWEGHAVRNAYAERVRTRLNKSEWQCVLMPCDPVVSVHIPANQPFGHDIVLASYKRMEELLKPVYPYRAVVCTSWLMDPVLTEMLGESANISRFQNDFVRYPSKASGRGVYTFLFNMPNAKPEELPENTSLRRKVKQRILDGGSVLELGGILNL
ncbi:MAG: hypothetical protein GX929_00440 [Clostridiales bacterium]|nr:hypothetical protein [Clostridiales bacterium]